MAGLAGACYSHPMRRNRALYAALLAVAVSALVGGFFGKAALATQDRVPDQYRLFTSALNALTTNNKLTLTMLKLKLTICQKSITETQWQRRGPLQGKSLKCLKA